MASCTGLYDVWVIVGNLWSNWVGFVGVTPSCDCGNLQSNPVDFAGMTSFFPKSSPLCCIPFLPLHTVLSLTFLFLLFLPQLFPHCCNSENGCTTQSFLKPFSVNSATMTSIPLAPLWYMDVRFYFLWQLSCSIYYISRMGQWDVAFLNQFLTFHLNVVLLGEGGCWTPIHPILNPLLVAPHFWKPPCDWLPPLPALEERCLKHYFHSALKITKLYRCCFLGSFILGWQNWAFLGEYLTFHLNVT